MAYEPDPRKLRQMLESSLQLLSADYDVQVTSLPGFVHIPDELALTFDDSFALVEKIGSAGLLDAAAVERLNGLRSALSQMSEKHSLWTVEAVRSDPEWQAIRMQARELLHALGVPVTTPDLSWGQYIPGARSSTPSASPLDLGVE